VDVDKARRERASGGVNGADRRRTVCARRTRLPARATHKHDAVAGYADVGGVAGSAATVDQQCVADEQIEHEDQYLSLVVGAMPSIGKRGQHHGPHRDARRHPGLSPGTIRMDEVRRPE
jgi:hypothetical protein